MADGTKRIWELDCGAITIVLAHGVPPKLMQECAQPCVCKCCAHLIKDRAWVLQGVHRACHAKNEVSLRMESYLNTTYPSEIVEVREHSLLSLARLLNARSRQGRVSIGTVWALVTDAAADKRNLGQRMVHALVLRGAQPADTTAIDNTGLRSFTGMAASLN